MTVKESLRASKIVRGLLDFARQRPPEMRPVNLNDVLQSAAELVSYELHSHGVDVSLDLSPEIPITLADAHQLQQVFVNLLNNAWQAISLAKQSGHVCVKSELTSPARADHLGAGSRNIRITIHDDGPGIPPGELPRVFDPFFTTKPEGVGTGLGLSICHGIISKHGGSIQVDSQVQAGSTFVIELPVDPSDTGLAEGVVPAPGIPKQARRGRILIIDDEPPVLEVLTKALQLQGYTVDSFHDAGKALQKIREADYAAILCDIRMPGINGPEFYWEISKNHPELARRIVFITGDTMSLRTRAFIEREDILCLTKPFELDELYQAVRKTSGDAPDSPF
jgi:CheY-like chemotaxis protein/two-component sensor histidine kinase